MSADRKMDGDSGIATGQQMGFLRFPTELQMQFFSHFCFHCTQEPICPETTLALHSCSLVCKSWRAVTLPLMWHQPSLSGNRRVKFLAGLFSENPQLAKHVESIRYKLPHRPLFKQRFGLHPFEQYDVSDIQAFLAVVDKIKSLSLRGMWDTNLFGYLANRQHRLGLDYLFPNLRSVLIQGASFPCRIYNSGFEGGEIAIQDRRLDCRFLLQMAPNLHTLELYGMDRIDEPITNNTGEACVLRQPLPTRLRNIRFLNSIFLGDEDQQLFLRPLFEHCAALERFTMQLRACQCLACLSIKLVSPGDLVDMLETQKNSLKYLELNYLDPGDLLSSLDGEFETTPAAHFTTNAWYVSSNLATFPVLEELHIDEQSFCRHWQTRSYVEDGLHTCLTDIVPQSLQRLLVWVRPESRAWEDIGLFCNQVARGCYTNLQRMNLVFHVSGDEFPLEFVMGNLLPGVMIFVQKAREIKHLLEAFKVVFRAGLLASYPRDGATKDFQFLSDGLEELLDIETLELPFSSDEDLLHDRCSWP